MSQNSLFDKWITCLNKTFDHKYNGSLTKTAELRLDTIRQYMENHLKETITIRNKLAHGQWIFPLNSDLTSIEQQTSTILRTHNIKILQEQRKLLNAIAELVNDLVLSTPTFERDFDRHFQKIENIERDMTTRSYEDYKKALMKRYENGRKKKS